MHRALETAKELERRGQLAESMQMLETLFQALTYWEDEGKGTPELHRIFDDARRTAARVRGEMATAVMQGGHWMGGLSLGLDTVQERTEAFDEADLQYRVALSALGGADPFGAIWGLGFLNGILFLAESEGASDLADEMRSRISDLRSRIMGAAA
jgi:hypothetical protein